MDANHVIFKWLKGRTIGVFGGAWKQFPTNDLPEDCRVIYEPWNAKRFIHKLQKIDVVVVVSSKVSHNGREIVQGAAAKRGVPFVYCLATHAPRILYAAAAQLSVERGK